MEEINWNQELKNKSLQELFDCAFEQGFGTIAKKSPGVYLPHIPKKIAIRLLEINEQTPKN